MRDSRCGVPGPVDVFGGCAVTTSTLAQLDSGHRGWRGCAGGRVDVGDGVTLDVADCGATRVARHTVVFLHGLCLTRVSWQRQIDYLLRRYSGVRVISYDHRGHGRSESAPMRTYRVDQLADDLAQVLRTLQATGPVTLVGHSLGGMVALAYLGRPAAARPVDPQGLVLAATAAGHLAARGLGRLLGMPAMGALVDLIDHTPAPMVRAAAGPVCAALSRLRDSADGHRQGLAAVVAAALATTPVVTAVGFLPGLRSYDQSGVLGLIRARTVVVSGGADLLTPPSHSAELAAAIPGAVHVHLPDCGHMLPQEAPQVLNDAIRRTMALAWPEAAQHRVSTTHYEVPAS
jgi:pimeloyl-ACP methyl ester carboxylesterase